MPSPAFLSKILLNFRKNSLNICLPESQFLHENNAIRVLSVLEFFKSFSEYYELSTLADVCCYHYVTQHILGQGT